MTKENKKMNAEQIREANINKNVKQGLKENLASAKKNKNDEFYTRLEDIANEVKHHIDHFKDKVVLMNCDDPKWSNFWKYFEKNQQHFGIKKLISTHYEPDGSSSYALIREKVIKNGQEGYLTKTIKLEGNGDFRSKECIEFLEEADIVVTNPPFSLFREYVALLVEHNKKFLILGNSNAITYKETFNLIKESKLWLGVEGYGHTYLCPIEGIDIDLENSDTYTEKKLGMTIWFTNLGAPTGRPKVQLNELYEGNEDKYPKYDNYDAINVNKSKDIPADYFGVMGVPVTFLHKLNTDQFEIVGLGKDSLFEMLNRGTLMEEYGKGKPKGNKTKDAKGTLYLLATEEEINTKTTYKKVSDKKFYSSPYARLLIRRVS